MGDALRLSEDERYVEAFDVVHCGAALRSPEPWLLRMVRKGGRAVVPIGPTDAPQQLCAVDKRPDGSVEVAQHLAVLYVPVVQEQEQRERGKHWDEVVERCCKSADAQ